MWRCRLVMISDSIDRELIPITKSHPCFIDPINELRLRGIYQTGATVYICFDLIHYRRILYASITMLWCENNNLSHFHIYIPIYVYELPQFCTLLHSAITILQPKPYIHTCRVVRVLMWSQSHDCHSILEDMTTSSNGNISRVTGPLSPHKGQWLGALMFSLICALINGWVSNRKASDLRRHRAHYGVTVMELGRNH